VVTCGHILAHSFPLFHNAELREPAASTVKIRALLSKVTHVSLFSQNYKSIHGQYLGQIALIIKNKINLPVNLHHHCCSLEEADSQTFIFGNSEV